MLDLKKMIRKYMRKITMIGIGIILVFAFAIFLLIEQDKAKDRADLMFVQIEQLLEENQKDLSDTQREYSLTCLNNAETIAYIIQNDPSIQSDIKELEKIAKFTEVDEIHLIDESGCIYFGTHPKYYGYTFASGDQIGFFKPMLTDKNLRLCQKVMPNTAEGKMMQYSAVWSENQEFIVQVGMNPTNVMKNAEKSQLPYVISLLRVDVGVNFYAIDKKTGQIVAATMESDIGLGCKKVGLDLDKIEEKDYAFHAKINGKSSFCVFKDVGEFVIARVVTNEELYNNVPSSTAGLALALILIAILLVKAVTWCTDTYVIRGIHNVNKKLRVISKGNLDADVNIHTCQEFSELSIHINEMVRSICANTDKLSYVLNKTDMHIGVYEYNMNARAIRYTEYVPKILALTPQKTQELSSDYEIFRQYMGEICSHPLLGEEDIYQIDPEIDIYVKIEEVRQGDEVFGIIMDVSEEVMKRREIEAERDLDLLTGLYNRRGIESQLAMLFQYPDALQYGALIMIDADGLKGINDYYGHEKGDRYLQKIAEALMSFGLRGSVAARQGGDEFVLFLYGYESEELLEDALSALEYIQNNSIAHIGRDLDVPLSFSFGVSLTYGEVDYQRLLKLADQRMYENKRYRKEMMNTEWRQ